LPTVETRTHTESWIHKEQKEIGPKFQWMRLLHPKQNT
jgi:hypothetical protein